MLEQPNKEELPMGETLPSPENVEGELHPLVEAEGEMLERTLGAEVIHQAATTHEKPWTEKASKALRTFLAASIFAGSLGAAGFAEAGGHNHYTQERVYTAPYSQTYDSYQAPPPPNINQEEYAKARSEAYERAMRSQAQRDLSESRRRGAEEGRAIAENQMWRERSSAFRAVDDANRVVSGVGVGAATVVGGLVHAPFWLLGKITGGIADAVESATGSGDVKHEE